MEPKEYVLLGILISIAVIGSGILIYVLESLDKEDEKEDENQHHHH